MFGLLTIQTATSQHTYWSDMSWGQQSFQGSDLGAGVSLSSGSRSAVAINPDSPQAEALRAWWNTEGRSSALSPLTQEQRCVRGPDPLRLITPKHVAT